MAENATKPTFSFIGMSNEADTAILNANSVISEPLKHIEGLNAYTEKGINGKGEEGAQNIVSSQKLYGDIAHAGEVVNVSTRFATLKSFTMPSLDNPMERYTLFYDQRRNSSPIKIIKETLEHDAKTQRNKIVSAEVVNSKGIILKERELEVSDIQKAAAFAAQIAQSVEMKTGFVEELQKADLLKELRTIPQLSKFLSVFDQYFEKSDENTIIASKIKRDQGIKFSGIDAFEMPKESISETFSVSKFDQIAITTLDSARVAKELLDAALGKGVSDELKEKLSNPNEGNNMVIAGRYEFFKKVVSDYESDFDTKPYASIRTRGEVTVGYDNTGSIVLLENYGVKTRSNGEIYKEEKELNKALSELRGAHKAVSQKARGADNAPSDDVVSKSIDIIVEKAQEAARNLFGENDKLIDSLDIPENGEFLSEQLLNPSDDKDAFRALGKLNSLHSLAFKATFKKFFEENDVSNNDFLTKDKKRISNISYANNEPENFAREVLDIDDMYQAVVLNAKLPSLTFPVGQKNINFKELAASVVKVYKDRESGKVIDVARAADISYWSKGSGRLGLVLSRLSELDPKSKSFDNDLKAVMNYGVKIKGKQTNFGILGVMKDQPNVKERLGGFLNELYTTIKEQGYEEGMKLLDGLKDSPEPNMQTLGVYLDEVKVHKDRISALGSAYYAIKKENSKMITDLVNGKEVEFVNGDRTPMKAYDVYKVKATATTISADIKRLVDAEVASIHKYPVEEGSKLKERLDKLNQYGIESPLALASFDIGSFVKSTTLLNAVTGYNKDGERRYFINNSIHSYPTGVSINPYIKTQYSSEVDGYVTTLDKDALKNTLVSTHVDVSDKMESIRQEYVEARKKEYVKEDKYSRDIESSIGVPSADNTAINMAAMFGIPAENIKTKEEKPAEEQPVSVEVAATVDTSMFREEISPDDVNKNIETSAVADEIDVVTEEGDIAPSIEAEEMLTMDALSETLDCMELSLDGCPDLPEDEEPTESIAAKAIEAEKAKSALDNLTIPMGTPSGKSGGRGGR